MIVKTPRAHPNPLLWVRQAILVQQSLVFFIAFPSTDARTNQIIPTTNGMRSGAKITAPLCYFYALDAATFDAEPSAPVGRGDVADIGDAGVGLSVRQGEGRRRHAPARQFEGPFEGGLVALHFYSPSTAVVGRLGVGPFISRPFLSLTAGALPIAVNSTPAASRVAGRPAFPRNRAMHSGWPRHRNRDAGRMWWRKAAGRAEGSIARLH
jgi:hypothetical protein